ncbi:MAG: DUF397 domain-containing protein [Stackebrandtia sp.]
MTAHPVAINWRKSTRSADSTGQCVEVGAWRKSRRSVSGGDQNCVEVASCTCASVTVAVRDTKHREGGMLTATRADWAALLTTLRTPA